jgi:threonine synthase
MDETGYISKAPDMKLMQKEIYSVSINDKETKQMISDAYKEHKLLLEPHGSVGWAGLQRFLKDNLEYDSSKQLCISLETAHPAKFPEQIREILNFDPVLPVSLEGIEEKEEFYDKIENEYEAFKAYLKEKY